MRKCPECNSTNVRMYNEESPYEIKKGETEKWTVKKGYQVDYFCNCCGHSFKAGYEKRVGSSLVSLTSDVDFSHFTYAILHVTDDPNKRYTVVMDVRADDTYTYRAIAFDSVAREFSEGSVYGTVLTGEWRTDKHGTFKLYFQ